MSISEKTQALIRRNLSLEDVIPTRMPVYVHSLVYLFGALALSALVMLVLTGLVMVAYGPNWYHNSTGGHFFNSLHFWSTQVFFFGMVSHFITKFFMAAWRDGRWKAWILGVLSFAVFIPTALTGFLSQSNFDSQWIAVQAKDAFNALWFGSWFNTLNSGQILVIHVALLPFIAGVLVLAHIFFVRRDGPVKPIEKRSAGK